MEANVIPAEVVGNNDDNVWRFVTGCSWHEHQQDCHKEDVVAHLQPKPTHLQLKLGFESGKSCRTEWHLRWCNKRYLKCTISCNFYAITIKYSYHPFFNTRKKFGAAHNGATTTKPRNAIHIWRWCLGSMIVRRCTVLSCQNILAEYPQHHISSAYGRCFVCFVFDPASKHSPKTKHTKRLTQVDERKYCGKVAA